MAPLPNIADTYRCAFLWEQFNAVNVMHVHAATATPAAVGSAINGAVSSNMWNPKRNTDHIWAIDITPLDSMGATYRYTTDKSAKWAGGLSQLEVIPAACAVVSFKTVDRGAANRGRAFIGPVGEQAQVDGMLVSTVPPLMVTAWGNFGSAMITANMQHVVASYKHRTALTVVNYSIRNALGTLRPRQSRLAA